MGIKYVLVFLNNVFKATNILKNQINYEYNLLKLNNAILSMFKVWFSWTNNKKIFLSWSNLIAYHQRKSVNICVTPSLKMHRRWRWTYAQHRKMSPTNWINDLYHVWRSFGVRMVFHPGLDCILLLLLALFVIRFMWIWIMMSILRCMNSVLFLTQIMSKELISYHEFNSHCYYRINMSVRTIRI